MCRFRDGCSERRKEEDLRDSWWLHEEHLQDVDEFAFVRLSMWLVALQNVVELHIDLCDNTVISE